MTCYQKVLCPGCKMDDILRFGKTKAGIQRFLCKRPECHISTFILEYQNEGCKPGISKKIIDMAINGSGIRDTARVLNISKGTVIDTLKKQECKIISVNPDFCHTNKSLNVRIIQVCDEAECDEQWSYVGKKEQQRWLWYAIDHESGALLAYAFGRRKDEVFKRLKALLAPLNIKRYYTDDWGAYERHIDEEKHEVGKRNTQKIERKNLNFRAWIKRLARKTICFSKLEKMHDIVIGLLINKVEFKVNIYA